MLIDKLKRTRINIDQLCKLQTHFSKFKLLARLSQTILKTEVLFYWLRGMHMLKEYFQSKKRGSSLQIRLARSILRANLENARNRKSRKVKITSQVWEARTWVLLRWTQIRSSQEISLMSKIGEPQFSDPLTHLLKELEDYLRTGIVPPQIW